MLKHNDIMASITILILLICLQSVSSSTSTLAIYIYNRFSYPFHVLFLFRLYGFICQLLYIIWCSGLSLIICHNTSLPPSSSDHPLWPYVFLSISTLLPVPRYPPPLGIGSASLQIYHENVRTKIKALLPHLASPSPPQLFWSAQALNIASWRLIIQRL